MASPAIYIPGQGQGQGYGRGYDYGDQQLAQMMYNARRGYGGAAGEMYNQAISGVGRDIASAMIHYHQQHVRYNQQLGIANALSRLGIDQQGNPVPLTDAQGKTIKGVTPVMNKAALDTFNAAAGSNRDQATGALTVLNQLLARRVQGLQAAAIKQAATNQTIAQGPTTAVTSTGNYIWDDKAKTWRTNTAVPKDVMGRTAEQQIKDQQAADKQAAAQQVAAQKAFNSGLKGIGIASPQDLFDPNSQESGTVIPGQGFITQPPNDTTVDPSTGTMAPQTVIPQTHVRIGYQAPVLQTDDNGKPVLNRQGNPIVLQPGRRGTVIPADTLNSYQDAAAQLAGPQASQALQWLRQNPNDDMAPQVQQKLTDLIAKTGTSRETPPITVSTAPSSPPAPAFQPQDQTQYPRAIPVTQDDTAQSGGGSNPSANYDF